MREEERKAEILVESLRDLIFDEFQEKKGLEGEKKLQRGGKERKKGVRDDTMYHRLFESLKLYMEGETPLPIATLFTRLGLLSLLSSALLPLSSSKETSSSSSSSTSSSPSLNSEALSVCVRLAGLGMASIFFVPEDGKQQKPHWMGLASHTDIEDVILQRSSIYTLNSYQKSEDQEREKKQEREKEGGENAISIEINKEETRNKEEVCLVEGILSLLGNFDQIDPFQTHIRRRKEEEKEVAGSGLIRETVLDAICSVLKSPQITGLVLPLLVYGLSPSKEEKQTEEEEEEEEETGGRNRSHFKKGWMNPIVLRLIDVGHHVSASASRLLALSLFVSSFFPSFPPPPLEASFPTQNLLSTSHSNSFPVPLPFSFQTTQNECQTNSSGIAKREHFFLNKIYPTQCCFLRDFKDSLLDSIYWVSSLQLFFTSSAVSSPPSFLREKKLQLGEMIEKMEEIKKMSEEMGTEKIELMNRLKVSESPADLISSLIRLLNFFLAYFIEYSQRSQGDRKSEEGEGERERKKEVICVCSCRSAEVVLFHLLSECISWMRTCHDRMIITPLLEMLSLCLRTPFSGLLNDLSFEKSQSVLFGDDKKKRKRKSWDWEIGKRAKDEGLENPFLGIEKISLQFLAVELPHTKFSLEATPWEEQEGEKELPFHLQITYSLRLLGCVKVFKTPLEWAWGFCALQFFLLLAQKFLCYFLKNLGSEKVSSETQHQLNLSCPFPSLIFSSRSSFLEKIDYLLGSCDPALLSHIPLIFDVISKLVVSFATNLFSSHSPSPPSPSSHFCPPPSSLSSFLSTSPIPSLLSFRLPHELFAKDTTLFSKITSNFVSSSSSFLDLSFQLQQQWSSNPLFCSKKEPLPLSIQKSSLLTMNHIWAAASLVSFPPLRKPLFSSKQREDYLSIFCTSTQPLSSSELLAQQLALISTFCLCSSPCRVALSVKIESQDELNPTKEIYKLTKSGEQLIFKLRSEMVSQQWEFRESILEFLSYFLSSPFLCSPSSLSSHSLPSPTPQSPFHPPIDKPFISLMIERGIGDQIIQRVRDPDAYVRASAIKAILSLFYYSSGWKWFSSFESSPNFHSSSQNMNLEELEKERSGEVGLEQKEEEERSKLKMFAECFMDVSEYVRRATMDLLSCLVAIPCRLYKILTLVGLLSPSFPNDTRSLEKKPLQKYQEDPDWEVRLKLVHFLFLLHFSPLSPIPSEKCQCAHCENFEGARLFVALDGPLFLISSLGDDPDPVVRRQIRQGYQMLSQREEEKEREETDQGNEPKDAFARGEMKQFFAQMRELCDSRDWSEEEGEIGGEEEEGKEEEEERGDDKGANFDFLGVVGNFYSTETSGMSDFSPFPLSPVSASNRSLMSLPEEEEEDVTPDCY